MVTTLIRLSVLLLGLTWTSAVLGSDSASSLNAKCRDLLTCTIQKECAQISLLEEAFEGANITSKLYDALDKVGHSWNLISYKFWRVSTRVETSLYCYMFLGNRLWMHFHDGLSRRMQSLPPLSDIQGKTSFGFHNYGITQIFVGSARGCFIREQAWIGRRMRVAGELRDGLHRKCDGRFDSNKLLPSTEVRLPLFWWFMSQVLRLHHSDLQSSLCIWRLSETSQLGRTLLPNVSGHRSSEISRWIYSHR